jgi:hypothetical protein
MGDENDDLVPQKQSLFPVSADDIVDNEKRKAEYRSDRAQDEMRSLINNANLLDEKVGDYKINSTFETATGTTSVEIKKSRTNTLILIAVIVGFIFLALLVVLMRS